MSKINTWKIVGVSVGTLAFGTWAWRNRRLFTVSDITTGESAAYPTLRSRVYYAEIPKTLNAAAACLSNLPGFALTQRDTANDAVEGTAAGAFGLTDDLTVYCFDSGRGQTRVTIRARARSGIGDFGHNAAHIRALQGAMDARLNAGAAF